MCSSTPIVSETGRTLIVGSTGFIGQFIVEACLKLGRPTYVLVRSRQTSPSKISTLKFLQDKGAVVLHVISCHFSSSFFFQCSTLHVHAVTLLSNILIFIMLKYKI